MADVVLYIGPTAQTLYARIQTGASSFVAIALTEGSTSLLNHYAAADSAIAALTGMNVAGDYPFQIRAGGTPSTTAADPLVAFGELAWTGSTVSPGRLRHVYNKLPSSNYLTGTSDSGGAVDLTATIGVLAGSKFSTDAVKKINPGMIYNSTILEVNSQTSVGFGEADYFLGADSLSGGILIVDDSVNKFWAPITSSSSFDDVVTLTLGTHSGTISIGNQFWILAPTDSAVMALSTYDRTQQAAILTAVLNVQNNTFVSSNIPQTLEKPDASSSSVAIIVLFADETGTAKNLDSGNPTMTLVNAAGTDLSGRLGSWTNPATGKYTRTYTNSSTDSVELLLWEVTGTINSKLRRYVATTQIVEETAERFTVSDRTNLNAIVSKLPSKSKLAGTNNSDGDIQLNEATGTLLDSAFPTTLGQLFNPEVFLQNATVLNVVGNDVYISSPDYFNTDNFMNGGRVVFNDGVNYGFATISSQRWETDILILTLGETSGIVITGMTISVLSGVVGTTERFGQSDRTNLNAIANKLPSKSTLAGTNNSDGDIQLNEATGSLTSLHDSILGRLQETSDEVVAIGSIVDVVSQAEFTVGLGVFISDYDYSGKRLLFYAGATSTLLAVREVGSLTADTLLIGEDYLPTVGDRFVVVEPGFTRGDANKLAAIFNKLPSRPFLLGSTYSDGSVDTVGAEGLAEAITTALENAEFEFPEELLDVLRDYLMGGKQYVESRVDISTVAPTTTKLAGHAELSAENDFYSKTNSVLAFVSGQLQGLCNTIVDYDGPSRTFFFADPWPAVPVAEDKFIILGKITNDT